jgi:hypothetical protein
MFGYMGGTPKKIRSHSFSYHKICVYLNLLAHISDFQTDLRDPSSNNKHFKKMSNKSDFCHHATAPAPYICSVTAIHRSQELLSFAYVILLLCQTLKVDPWWHLSPWVSKQLENLGKSSLYMKFCCVNLCPQRPLIWAF